MCLNILDITQEVFRLETPGGGGFGDQNLKDDSTPPVKRMKVVQPTGSVASYKLMQESV